MPGQCTLFTTIGSVLMARAVLAKNSSSRLLLLGTWPLWQALTTSRYLIVYRGACEVRYLIVGGRPNRARDFATVHTLPSQRHTTLQHVKDSRLNTGVKVDICQHGRPDKAIGPQSSA